MANGASLSLTPAHWLDTRRMHPLNTASLLSRTAVLIPALNEEDALPAVLSALPMDQLHAVVVADNGSTDGTARIARQAGAVVVREEERGYGAACLAGITCLPVVLEPLAHGADLVLGVRVGSGGTGNLHRHARWGNRVVLVAVHLLFGRHFQDLPPFRPSASVRQRLGMDPQLGMDARPEVHGPTCPKISGRSVLATPTPSVVSRRTRRAPSGLCWNPWPTVRTWCSA